LIGNLVALIGSVNLGKDEDRWVWTPEESGLFTVRSCYRVLEELLLLQDGLSALEEEVFVNLWRSPAPSKVVPFSWMAMMDRIPTRANLRIRSVLPSGEPITCVLCGGGEETTSHLFLHCEAASQIWHKVLDWLGVNIITLHNLLAHFACWSGEVNPRHLKRTYWLI